MFNFKVDFASTIQQENSHMTNLINSNYNEVSKSAIL